MRQCQSCGTELPSTAAPNTIFCADCRKARKYAYHQQWRTRNKEHEKAYGKAYKQAHKDHAKQRDAKYRAAHPDQVRQWKQSGYRSRQNRLSGVSRSNQVAVMDDAAKAKFWSKVDRSGDCWLWTGSHNSNGYGTFYLGGRNILAHRVAYQLANGSIVDDLLVCHRCDNPPCCNPNHLFLGTNGDNIRDMASKGRHWYKHQPEKQRRGEQVKNAKFTDSQVREIRALARAGVSQREIARRFGSHQRNISRIVRRQAWTHVTDEEHRGG